MEGQLEQIGEFEVSVPPQLLNMKRVFDAGQEQDAHVGEFEVSFPVQPILMYSPNEQLQGLHREAVEGPIPGTR